jgi:DNA-binding transcriptional LysR family regulator
MVWTGHSTLHDKYEIDEESYRAARHVTARDERLAGFAGDPQALELLGARQIVMRTTSQAALPGIVVDGDLIATGSVWLFQYYASILPVKVVEPPFNRPQVLIVAQCAPHKRRDPMLAWFARQLEGQFLQKRHPQS